MQKTKLIFNPIANLGRAWPVVSSLRPIVNEYGNADWAGTVYPTHATELARQAGEEGYDRVIAMGGDGTMHEVINGLMQLPLEKRPRLGVVPIGSGNDFSHAVGISSKPEEAMRQVLSGTPHKLDIARMTDNHGRSEYWANAVGIGFDAIVTINSRKVPVLKGFGIYLAAVIKTIMLDYENFIITARIDGQEWQREVFLLALCNGPREGGGFHVAPGATPDDGWLNYLSMEKMSRLNMFITLPQVMNGTHLHHPRANFGRFKKMELHSNRPLYIHTDGEIFAAPPAGVNALTVEILEGQIEVIR
jgi:YegS/Rv2252/BmrU family lipid kinase